MTTFTLPKSVEVTVCNKDLSSLLAHLIKTVNNHLRYIEDDSITETQWHKLKCNSIESLELHPIEHVAHKGRYDISKSGHGTV